MRQNGTAPEDTPVIFNESTIAKPWGWIFFYNNERFHQTRDISCQWVGPGPIFFNRNTGDDQTIRIRLRPTIMSYTTTRTNWPPFMVAGAFELSGSQDRAATSFKLKTAYRVEHHCCKENGAIPALLFVLRDKRTHLAIEWNTNLHNRWRRLSDFTLEVSTDIALNAFEDTPNS